MLRVVVTILVLISHCMYYRIVTAYGGIDYSGLFSKKTTVFIILEQIKEMIYSFHMPLYMALSGALFRVTISKRKICFTKLIKNKTTRLLIPFLLVSIFYSFPLKYISGYWRGTESVIKDFLLGKYYCKETLISGFCQHYLSCFCCFMSLLRQICYRRLF
ncbi:acyltransferase family protein [Ruminococcus sp. SR1/5]|uniref:acyltransferase family protein n=1 Tax=Ruminococcus sp. SR1/5 TaxID=657323 RepID=UPI0026810592